MNGKILIVGGYGGVGRIIATALGSAFPGQVIAAGRSYRKARELSLETGQKVLPLELDIATAHENDELLDDIALVVMCIDQANTRFVEKCIRRGIHYIDISAGHEFLSNVESLDADAKRLHATVVLSVGLEPGLTNLLASHCKSVLDEMRRVDIFVMLGLGDAHGEAAIRWTIENLNAEFSIMEDGVMKRVRSFESGKQTTFPDKIGKRTAYRFNFPDQHVIPRTLSVASASSWFCLDSALVTHLFAFLTKVGIVRMLRVRSIHDVVVRMLKTFHFGSDKFVLKVDASGIIDGRQTLYECSISGYGEGRATALVAAGVAERVYASSLPSGVFHIEQLFDPAEFIDKLSGSGLSFVHS